MAPDIGSVWPEMARPEPSTELRGKVRPSTRVKINGTEATVGADGKFTTTLPTAGPLAWDENGSATADGAMPLREVNRALGLSLPTDGPKTLNGLIVEHLQEIPEADVSIKINNVPMEIVHAQGRTIKTVRIFRPLASVESTETSEV